MDNQLSFHAGRGPASTIKLPAWGSARSVAEGTVIQAPGMRGLVVLDGEGVVLTRDEEPEAPEGLEEDDVWRQGAAQAQNPGGSLGVGVLQQ